MHSARDEKLLKKFGRGVAQVRKSRSMTHQELAEQVGVSVVAIAYVETGKRWPKLTTLHAIARALKVNIRDLFVSL